MYKCNECGCIFDEPETWQECRGEFWGVMSYETLAGCPKCYSLDYEEITDDEEKDDDGEEDDDSE